jgi:uncharacterized OB-fold protein
MQLTHGVCTKCGQVVVPSEHECSDAIARLAQIDREAGPRSVREAMIALNQKGFNNKVEALEAEAQVLRTQL